MYHKHRTEGIVIRSLDRGDSSKTLVLFTKEFGLIYPSVQSARSMSSKMRYSVQDYTLGNFSLIRGKHVWRVAGAESKQILWNNQSFIKILHCLAHLAGEEKNELLYEKVRDFLTHGNEQLTMLQVLKMLGYVKETDEQIVEISKEKHRATLLVHDSLGAAGVV